MAAPVGTAPLRALQMGYETTRFTAHAATKVFPFLSGDPNFHYDKHRRQEYRASRVREFLPPITDKQFVELAFDLTADYEGIGFLLGGAIKKVAAPTLSGTAIYTATFATLGTADDRATITAEYCTDVQDYQIPGCVVDELAFGWEKGSPVSLNVKLLGQKAVEATRTASLSAYSGREEMASSSGIVYIDESGGTIGATPYALARSFKVTYAGHYVQDFPADGNAYPSEAYSGEGLAFAGEMSAVFSSKAEFAKAQSTSERLIQVKLIGGTISGSNPSTPKSIAWNLYGYWDTHPFNLTDGRIRADFAFEGTTYDSSASLDGSVVLVNGVSAYA